MSPPHSPSPSLASPPSQIRILTLNCWGLKYISKFRHERMSEIGRQLAIADPPPQIVGLQECWTQQDYESIRQQTRDILPYGKFYFGGIFGAGLAILSKWPIEESSMFAYPLNGRPTAFFRGDWFVGKGVACARIRFGPAAQDVAEVFCTHLHAPYEREPHDSYLCHRTAQAWEIAKLMRGAAERGHLVIGLGDFNMIPSSFAHRLIHAHAPVRDVWQVLHPDSSVGATIDPPEQQRNKPMPSAAFNLSENGATCDGKFNTWRWSKEDRKRLEKGHDVVVDPDAPCPYGKRLDYIFVGDGGFPPDYPAARWSVESVAIGMTQRHPTLRCSLSDHFAVEAVIARDVASAGKSDAKEMVIHPVSSAPNAALTPDTYDRIIEMIHAYVRRERSQRHWRLTHFVASVVVAIGCFVGVWWTGDHLPYVAFILCLVSTLSFGAGILDGLIGGLFVSSELRALKEFEWEVRNAKRIVDEVGTRGTVNIEE
ncbi:inositol phosphosphingolipid phospholipase [Aspergillus clavatus NRRL 1]|uniref:Sphingomyelinase family protein, putative n=1 Tax=Aspergillus clavatus (strain ATCC 1007 / CBS 513.65 / DSM 816 / NCTC 3887 / NRRL 1 / QM 1276 / 107) TaxID=344612 RepID=A1CTA2_ASPCL|nr:sphingomyelinase family protein, putative [Aspergillus clavatus NRRL 1]EAW06539.1 sphingomyelinase family protein, putative [Aspergillus clavatus NRRL 1]